MNERKNLIFAMLAGITAWANPSPALRLAAAVMTQPYDMRIRGPLTVRNGGRHHARVKPMRGSRAKARKRARSRDRMRGQR